MFSYLKTLYHVTCELLYLSVGNPNELDDLYMIIF